MSSEEILYAEIFKKVNFYLTISGSYIDMRDKKRTALQRFLNRKFYCFNLIFILSHLLGELMWAVDGIKTGQASMVQLTYIIPCATLCLIGIGKSYFLIKNGDLVNDLITTVRVLQADSAKTERKVELEDETKKRTVILTTILNANNFLYAFGLSVFAIGPIIISWLMYRASGELVMQLPFLSVFPFDETDIKFWPLAYVHQIWAGFIAISTVHGPDSFYSYSCTFLLIQFKTLHYDILRICPENADFSKLETQDEYRVGLRGIMQRHNELIRCVDLVENIYSKSTLGNVAVSSVVICVSAFNVATIDDFFLMVPFIAFLIMWVLQVFVLCYFSDLLIESSSEVSNAVYNSNWYNASASIMKDLLFILTRAQKPCKLTALGFTDLNLRVFNKICSSAWSYFALLQTVYNK